MKFLRATLPIWALLALIASLAFLDVPALAAASPRATTTVLAVGQAVVTAPVSVNAQEAPAPVEPPDTGKLGGYVLEAMVAWMPKNNAAPSTHLSSIARDIAWVVLEEPRIWDGSNGGREAILLARIAWFETLYRDYVDDGSCQTWAQQAQAHGNQSLSKEAQRLMLLGTCDGGQAIGIWQCHYDCGSIHLYENGSWQNGCNAPVYGRLHWTITKGMALDSRRAQAKVALAMARASIRAGAGLRNYVGGDGPERAGMAAMRLDSAEAWSRKHPYAP